MYYSRAFPKKCFVVNTFQYPTTRDDPKHRVYTGQVRSQSDTAGQRAWTVVQAAAALLTRHIRQTEAWKFNREILSSLGLRMSTPLPLLRAVSEELRNALLVTRESQAIAADRQWLNPN